MTGRGRGRGFYRPKKQGGGVPFNWKNKGGGGGGGGGGNFSNSGGSRVSVTISVQVDYKTLTQFLNSKLKGLRWKSMKERPNGSGNFFMTLANQEDCRKVLSLDGTSCNGNRLQIKSGGGGGFSGSGGGGGSSGRFSGRPFNAQRMKAVEEYLQSKYSQNGSESMMQLTGMAGANTLFDFKNSNFIATVARILKNRQIKVTTLILDKNGINNLEMLKPICQLLKDSLARLSLANNMIPDLQQMKFLSSLNLRELILDPNPGTKDIVPEIKMVAAKELFPKLIKLNNIPVTDVVQFDLPEMLTQGNLPDEKGGAIEPKIQEIVTKFLTRYVQIFDKESRERLDDFYFRESSCFSIVCQPQRLRNNNSVYESADRNLKGDRLVTELSDRTRVGRSSILSLLKSLPNTVHELDKFTVDAFQPTNSATVTESLTNFIPY